MICNFPINHFVNKASFIMEISPVVIYLFHYSKTLDQE